MLWGYFDESGIHDPTTGKLSSLTIGGCIAPLDAWKTFTPLWQAALDTEPSVKCFHMTDFEYWKKPYDWFSPDDSRDKDRHEAFLNRLLDAIIPNVKMFIGYTNFVYDEDVDDFEAVYVKGIVDMIKHGIQDYYTSLGEQQVHWVFAHHEDVKERRIKDYHQVLDWAGQRVAGVSVERPANLLPLQAADLVAYELARANRESIPMRYPYKRLLKGSEDMRTIFRVGVVPSLAGKDAREPLV